MTRVLILTEILGCMTTMWQYTMLTGKEGFELFAHLFPRRVELSANDVAFITVGQLHFIFSVGRLPKAERVNPAENPRASRTAGAFLKIVWR